MTTEIKDERSSAVPLTATEKFFRHFQHEVTDLQEQMARVENHGTSGGERSDAIEHCLSTISRLSGEVQDASAYIPPHDKKTYGEAIKALQNKLQAVRATGAPRQKFAFKKSGPMFTTMKNASAISLSDAAELAGQKRRQLSGPPYDASNASSFVSTPVKLETPENEAVGHSVDVNEGAEPSSSEKAAEARHPSSSTSKSIAISNHNNEHIVLSTSTSNTTSSGTIFGINRSVVDLSSPASSGKAFATLTLKNITSSLIICGHVDGAIHLTNIKDSVIVVASRQYRMHESSKCDIYLLTTSRPIIEDCAAIRFSPLPRIHMTQADEQVTNQWSNVDDFKWLRSEQSPHWSLLEESGRIPDRVWEETVPGGHNLSVDDILKAANVPH